MEYPTLFKLMGGIGIVICLTACQMPPTESDVSVPSSSASAAAPMSVAESLKGSEASSYSIPVERIFAEGLDFYDKGQYLSAIKKFRSPQLSKAWPELRVRALKYLAFSYCLINRLRQCKKTFEETLQIDPNFDLKPSERDHPMWGPVFQQVRSEHSNETVSDTHSASRGTPAVTGTQEQPDKNTNTNPTVNSSLPQDKSSQNQITAPSGDDTSVGRTVPNQ
jgi:hypothetical protein